MNDLLVLFFSCVSQYLIFTTLTHTCTNMFTTAAKRSWILTILASIIMTVASITLLLSQVPLITSIDQLQESIYTRIIAIYFQSYVLSDIIIGKVYYPKEITKVTGYIHHTLYFITIYFILRWNLSVLFVLVGIEEIPTVVLGIGYIDKSQRRDYLFGFTFFITRIVLHSIFILLVYTSYDYPYWMMALGVFPLNLYWFYKWIMQQYRRYQEYLEEIRFYSLEDDLEYGFSSDDEFQIKEDLKFFDRLSHEQSLDRFRRENKESVYG